MGNHLLALGPGNGSPIETLKVSSSGLAGTLAAELAELGGSFSSENANLLKFHGSYQQEDRDRRKERKKIGLDTEHSFMVRLRIPGGFMNARQYLAIDKLADRYANGTLRFTTRQAIQFHGVLKNDLKSTLREIDAELLSTLAACGDVNRNVMACPAPARSRVNLELGALADRLARRLEPRTRAYHEIWLDGELCKDSTPAEEPIYGHSYLPRKFKIGIAYPGDNCVDAFTQDIGLVAELAGDSLYGFTVLVGGGLGMTHGKSETFPRAASPLCFVSGEDAIPIVEAIVTLQRDYGDRVNRRHARLKYVVEERGIKWLKDEIESRLGRTLEGPHPVTFEDACDHLGWHAQHGGSWFLGLNVASGRVADTDSNRIRSALREVVEQFGCSLRLTGQQNALLCDISDKDRPSVTALLARFGIAVDPTSLGIVRYALACPALPTCGQALAEAERGLPALLEEFDSVLHGLEIAEERLSIRMTGCPNGCARPYMGDIGIVGRSLGLYDIYVGGDWANTRLNRIAFSKVRYECIVATLRPLLVQWAMERHRGETFGDFVQRVDCL